MERIFAESMRSLREQKAFPGLMYLGPRSCPASQGSNQISWITSDWKELKISSMEVSFVIAEN